MSNLTNIEKLKYMCHKVLPLVYDESLSYYEVLAKVRQKLNEVIALTQEQNALLDQMKQEITSWETTTDGKYTEFTTRMTQLYNEFVTTITTNETQFQATMNTLYDTFVSNTNSIIHKYKTDFVPDFNENHIYRVGEFCYAGDDNKFLYRCYWRPEGVLLPPQPFSTYHWETVDGVYPYGGVANILLRDINEKMSNQDVEIIQHFNEIADLYSSAETYNVGDVVWAKTSLDPMFQPSWHLYICTTAVETGEEFDPTKWEHIILAQYFEDQYAQFLEDYQRQFGVVQDRGSSTTDVMSQKAVSDELEAHDESISKLLSDLAPEYDDEKLYKIGILLTDSGKLYYCKKNAPAGTPVTNTEYFRDASVAGDFISIIKITDTTITLGDINTILNGTGGINPNGLHIMFDVGALGASMYLCTIYIDTASNVYKIFDLVLGRVAEGVYDANKLLTMCIANADTIATQSQIDSLQKEIDELGGKSVVEDWDVLGDKIADGTSTDVISAGDTVDIHWIASVLGTTTSGLTVTCSNIDTFANGVGEAEAKTYLFVYNGTAWTYNEEAIDLADFGLSVTGTPVTGEVMTIQTTVTTRSYTFTGYDDVEAVDSNVPHNWLMEQTYAPDTKVYDTYEALFAVYQGKRVPVGNYHLRCYSYRSAFNVDMYLAVTAELGSDDYVVQVRSNGYASRDITNADNVTKTGVLAISGLTPTIFGTRTNASGAVSIAYTPTADVTYTELTDLNVDPNDPVVFTSVGVFDKCALGNNCWVRSNLSEFLNDDTGAKASVTPTYMLDVPSAYNLGAGFLFGIDPRVKKLIQSAEVKWTSGQGNDDYTANQTYTAEQKVFLLSMKEMSFNINTAEGNMTDLYGQYTGNTLTNNAVAPRAKYNKAGGTLNSYRWSRSADTSYASLARYVTSTGAYDYSNAYYELYLAPAFILGKSVNH